MNNRGDAAGNTSFLPADYLEKKAERRSNLLCLTLFLVVIFCVVGAFFVTNRQWKSVKTQQEMINIRYTQAAQQIEQLKVLEKQKLQMQRKAEIVTSLIERVPRTVLLAELINRMPDQLTLLETNIESKRIVEAPSVRKDDQKSRMVSLVPGQRNAEEEEDLGPPPPPRYDTKVIIVGVAASHTQVARYVTSLQECMILGDVELQFSETTLINDRALNRFRIDAEILDGVDARRMEKLSEPPIHAFQEPAEGVTPDPDRVATEDPDREDN